MFVQMCVYIYLYIKNIRKISMSIDNSINILAQQNSAGKDLTP